MRREHAAAGRLHVMLESPARTQAPKQPAGPICLAAEWRVRSCHAGFDSILLDTGMQRRPAPWHEQVWMRV